MKNNYQKHNQKAKRLEKKIKAIEAKHPEIDFIKLRNAFIDFDNLTRGVLYEEVDMKACKSDKPEFMCSDCNCWKHTRVMSS